jgi:hypothetical protein
MVNQFDERCDAQLDRARSGSGAACAETAVKATPLTIATTTARIASSIRDVTRTVRARRLTEAEAFGRVLGNAFIVADVPARREQLAEHLGSPLGPPFSADLLPA